MNNQENPKRVKKSIYALLITIIIAAIIAVIGLMIDDEAEVLDEDDIHKTEEDVSGFDREKQKALKLLDEETEKTENAIEDLEEKAEQLNTENEITKQEIEFIETQPDRLKKYKTQLDEERKRIENLDAVRYSDVKEWVDAQNPRSK